MSLSASRLSPDSSAASPTTTAIRSRPWRMSRAVARPCGDRQARCRRGRRRTRRARDSVRRGKPPIAVDLAQRAEPLEAAGEQLVGVRLVPGVPDDPVARRLEQPVERERDLDDAERRAEVAAGRGDGPDDRLADLGGELARARRSVRPRRSAGPWRRSRIGTGFGLLVRRRGPLGRPGRLAVMRSMRGRWLCASRW